MSSPDEPRIPSPLGRGVVKYFVAQIAVVQPRILYASGRQKINRLGALANFN
jgi:hypothetical protein